MGYIKDLERELRELLEGVSPETIEPVVRFVKARVYDSYRNGRDGKAPETKPAPVAPKAPEPEPKPSRAHRVPVRGKFKGR